MQLNLEKVKEHLAYEPETGHFAWKLSTHGRHPGKCGSINKKSNYQIIRVLGVTVSAHRLAWFYEYGVWPKGQIDHVNGVRTDNRICNLRDVSRAVNQQNQRKAHIKNKCGLLGAHCGGNGKFTSRINVGGRRIYLGYFDTAEQANAAYIKAKRKHHDGCTI